MLVKTIDIGPFSIGPELPLVFLCGPCVIESEKEALSAAEELQKIFSKHEIPFVYKSSYDKANRSSLNSYRGPGIEKGLRILEKVKKTFGIPVMTDIHSPDEALAASEICEIIQIPAFLCRQTDLLVAAAKTPSVVNVKKGQFMAPWDMKNTVEKLVESGCEKILVTDRGSTFGYNNLVSDMRSIPIMKQFGFPVCFDATHSVQLPGGLGSQTGGLREFIPYLAKAAIAVGCNTLYMEAHRKPSIAKCDSSCMLSFDELSELCVKLRDLYDFVNERKAYALQN